MDRRQTHECQGIDQLSRIFVGNEELGKRDLLGVPQKNGGSLRSRRCV